MASPNTLLIRNMFFWRKPCEDKPTTHRDRSLRGKARIKARKAANRGT